MGLPLTYETCSFIIGFHYWFWILKNIYRGRCKNTRESLMKPAQSEVKRPGWYIIYWYWWPCPSISPPCPNSLVLVLSSFPKLLSSPGPGCWSPSSRVRVSQWLGCFLFLGWADGMTERTPLDSRSSLSRSPKRTVDSPKRQIPVELNPLYPSSLLPNSISP